LGTRVRDCDCALKVFRKEALADLLPQTAGFFVNTEMLARARQLDYEVAQVGVRHRPRLRGHSKVSIGDIPRTLRTLVPFWWSQVLFPNGANDLTSPQESSVRSAHPATTPGMPNWWSSNLQFPLLLVMAALLFFSHLGCPLQEPEESRYAEIPRQMLEAGNWAVPLLDGNPYYDKPPLLYWLVMGSYRVFGVHDWSARLVSSAAAFLTILLTYFWGLRVVGPRAGFTGAVILCLSGRFIFLGRLLTMNSLLCLCVVAGLAAAHLAVSGPRLRWRWWILSAAACGLGLLTKGPVAIVLIAVPVAAFLAVDPRAVRIGLRPWLVYLMTMAAVACPWYASAAANDPESLGLYFA